MRSGIYRGAHRQSFPLAQIALAGGAVSVFFFLNPELRPLDLHEGILGLAVHIPVLILVSVRSAPQEAAHVEAYVGYSA